MQVRTRHIINRLKMMDPESRVMVHIKVGYEDVLVDINSVLPVNVQENENGVEVIKSFDYNQNTTVISGDPVGVV